MIFGTSTAKAILMNFGLVEAGQRYLRQGFVTSKSKNLAQGIWRTPVVCLQHSHRLSSNLKSNHRREVGLMSVQGPPDQCSLSPESSRPWQGRQQGLQGCNLYSAVPDLQEIKHKIIPHASTLQGNLLDGTIQKMHKFNLSPSTR